MLTLSTLSLIVSGSPRLWWYQKRMGSGESAWTIENSIRQHRKITFRSHSLIKYWTLWQARNSFLSLMASVGITKSRSHPHIKTKLPLHALGVHFPTECFLSGCVMHPLPFKGFRWLFLLILNVLRFIWMIFLCLVTHLMELLKI